MAIQVRKGNAEDFDAAKMKSGELAAAEDTKQLYVSFIDGTAEEIPLKKYVDSKLKNLIKSHKDLTDRDAADQHPIGAITNLTEELDDRSPAVIATATGDAIAVSDSSDRQLRGLTIYGKTTQDGTPSPENPIPLVSAGDSGELNVRVYGKNLLDTSRFSNQYYAADGALLNASTMKLFDFIPVCAGDVLTLSGLYTGTSNEYLRWAVFDSRKVFLTRNNGTSKGESATINISQNGYIRVFISFDNYDADTLQLEISSTATPYEPYNAQFLTTQTPNGLPGVPAAFGGNYTDENGQQWVCDEIDFEQGEDIQKIEKIIYDGSADEQWTTAFTTSGAVRFLVPLPNVKSGVSNIKSNCLSNQFTVNTADDIYKNNIEGCAVNLQNLIIFTPTIQTMADLKTHLTQNPLEIIYELAEPIRHNLPADEIAAYKALHNNKPVTTILNDGGAGMSVSYVADTKAYIDNKFAALEAAILSTGGNV